MNEALIAQLDEEIGKKRAELAALENARTALSGGLSANGSGYAARPANGLKSSEKAPFGALQDSILKILKASSTPLRAGEIRAKIRESGYAYSLEPMYVSKTLLKLRNTKKIKSQGEHNNQSYFVP